MCSGWKVFGLEGSDESDGHVLLTPHGTVTGRSVRHLAGHLRVQPDLVGKSKSRIQDVSGRASDGVACICAHQTGR